MPRDAAKGTETLVSCVAMSDFQGRMSLLHVQRVSRSHRWWSAVLLVLCIGGMWVLISGHPSAMSWFPRCPLHATTGLHCPGCGASRAAHHVLHGRFAEGWAHNQAGVLLGIPTVIVLLIGSAMSVFRGKTLHIMLTPKAGMVLAAMVVLWFVLRNMPGLAVLRPPG